jgi:hypothetical protein
MPVFQFDLEHSVGQRLYDRTLKFDCFLFSQDSPLLGNKK